MGKVQAGAARAAACAKAAATFDLHSFCKCVLVGCDADARAREQGGSALVALAHGSSDVSLVMCHLLVCESRDASACRAHSM
jgi:hypothetical protein